MAKTVLIPLDLNQTAAFDSVFAAAKNAAGDELSNLILLTVFTEIDAGDFPYVGTDHLRKLGESARNQLERIGRERLGDSADWRIDIRVGPVARTIVRRADHFDADLIVIASHNPMFWDVLLGSTASQVVKHARHSVLVVRQKGSREHAEQGKHRSQRLGRISGSLTT